MCLMVPIVEHPLMLNLLWRQRRGSFTLLWMNVLFARRKTTFRQEFILMILVTLTHKHNSYNCPFQVTAELRLQQTPKYLTTPVCI